jgi:FkbM family methyltransferase
MSIKRLLASNNLLRTLLLPILRKLNFEFCWKHDVTGRKFYLLTFLHKGYWFYGAEREEEELKKFKELINRGDTVLEIGAHIGYVTQIFEEIVGESGKVLVAEPTEFSRQFLLKNKRDDTKVLPVAVSDAVGKIDFYTEHLGGFTNSIVRDFTEQSIDGLSKSLRQQKKSSNKVQVDTLTVDTISYEESISPHFIKIDVEGAELAVLKGAKQTLINTFALMVEVSRNHEDVYSLLYENGFKPIASNDNKTATKFPGGNIFFVKENEFNETSNE